MLPTLTNPALIVQLNPKLVSHSSKRPKKLTKGDLFHQDNTPAYKSVVAMAAVRDCGPVA